MGSGMQIVIPMSGQGQRFQNAGYTTPKPLIEVAGKPIIEHVIQCFPKEENFLFICNEEHLRTTPMEEILRKAAPKGKILGIPTHKLGPVYAVSKGFDAIKDDDEVIVNYCDFSKAWDWQGFLQHMHKEKADGGMAAYRGFHPHMLGTTNYAFIREHRQTLKEIQEKKPFTQNRMQEFASDGTYYFRNGSLLKQYFQKLMELGISTQGEFYVSMVYNLMAQDQKKVRIHEIDHMLQWGTPEDLEEFQYWYTLFERLHGSQNPANQPFPGTTILPMAGEGLRFQKEGFSTPKPFIPVSKKPMFQQALNCLPRTEKKVLIARSPLPLSGNASDTQVVLLSEKTDGQAATCLEGMKLLDSSEPVFIGACDHGMLLDLKALKETISSGAEVISFSMCRHPGVRRSPESWGYLLTDTEGFVQSVSVKKPLSSNPFLDPVITGAFWFSSKGLFQALHEEQIQRNLKINQEYYVDSLVGLAAELGHKVRSFPVKAYFGWGTPDDLRTFEYWQKFFHQCSWHPYRLESDWMAQP